MGRRAERIRANPGRWLRRHDGGRRDCRRRRRQAGPTGGVDRQRARVWRDDHRCVDRPRPGRTWSLSLFRGRRSSGRFAERRGARVRVRAVAPSRVRHHGHDRVHSCGRDGCRPDRDSRAARARLAGAVRDWRPHSGGRRHRADPFSSRVASLFDPAIRKDGRSSLASWSASGSTRRPTRHLSISQSGQRRERHSRPCWVPAHRSIRWPCGARFSSACSPSTPASTGSLRC